MLFLVDTRQFKLFFSITNMDGPKRTNKQFTGIVCNMLPKICTANVAMIFSKLSLNIVLQRRRKVVGGRAWRNKKRISRRL